MFFIIKNIFIMKNLTDFRKTVETGVDPRLQQDGMQKRTAKRLGVTNEAGLLRVSNYGYG